MRKLLATLKDVALVVLLIIITVCITRDPDTTFRKQEIIDDLSKELLMCNAREMEQVRVNDVQLDEFEKSIIEIVYSIQQFNCDKIITEVMENDRSREVRSDENDGRPTSIGNQ